MMRVKAKSVEHVARRSGKLLPEHKGGANVIAG
jgi:hypothetical protein